MKVRRHFIIMDIIAQQRVGTQEELCEILRKRGFHVTQATVSRDIKELKLVKIADSSGYRYALPDGTGNRSSLERMQRIFKDTVVACDASENIVVIKTLPGAAQSVASVIDSCENNEILGTVAGDDTILVVVRVKAAIGQVVNMFIEMMNR